MTALVFSSGLCQSDLVGHKPVSLERSTEFIALVSYSSYSCNGKAYCYIVVSYWSSNGFKYSVYRSCIVFTDHHGYHAGVVRVLYPHVDGCVAQGPG